MSTCLYSKNTTAQQRVRTDSKKQSYLSVRRSGIRAFTLIELVIVILIIGVMMTLLGLGSGTFTFWREEGFLRRLSEVITFLHHQAVVDQEMYRLEIDLDRGEYRVGIMKNLGNGANAQLAQLQEAGTLSLELANFLNPAQDSSQDMIPPPSFPSLAEPELFPPGVVAEGVRTMRGRIQPGKKEVASILFSPRGFSEFAIINLRLSSGAPVSLLVNPFTGVTEIYREFKDFEWNYGRPKDTRERRRRR